jgi:hypothetical protein
VNAFPHHSVTVYIYILSVSVPSSLGRRNVSYNDAVSDCDLTIPAISTVEERNMSLDNWRFGMHTDDKRMSSLSPRLS